MLDLEDRCALCGGRLELNPNKMRELQRAKTEDEVEDVRTYCSCESRELKGHCGSCRSCMVEDYGCACDGAYDVGCFNCTPNEFERPSCPKENFEHGHSEEARTRLA